MKKLLLLMLLGAECIFADSLVGTLGVGSKHFLPYDLNENNGGVGIGYQYVHNKHLSSQVDYIRFINSYKKPTEFTGYTLNYTPLVYKKAKLGVFGTIAYNEGYCGFFGRCKEGMDDTGILPMVGLLGELDNIIVKMTALPNIDEKKIDAVVGMVQMKIVEW